jgi:hypothetical protein
MEDDSGDDEHGSDLFDSSVLDSLKKLTEEIHEDLRADDAMAVPSRSSSGSYDSYDDDGDGDDDDDDDYSDDDEDPDSGETKLFSMMNDLVMELQVELEQTENEEMDEAKDVTPALTVLKNQAIVEPIEEEENEHTVPRPSPSIGDAENRCGGDGAEHSGFGHRGLIPPADSTNLPRVSDHNKTEKQARLRQHVKSLLRRVADLTHANQDGAGNHTWNDFRSAFTEDDGGSQKESGGGYQPETTDFVAGSTEGATYLGSNCNATGQRPRGDSGADRLERLMGAISHYSKSTDPKTSTPSLHAGHDVILESVPSESTESISNQRIGGVEGPDEQLESTNGNDQNSKTIGAGSYDDEAAGEGSNTAREMSKFTQRKSREYITREQSSSDRDVVDRVSAVGEVVEDAGIAPSPMTPRRSKTTRDAPPQATEAEPQTVLRGEIPPTAHRPRQRHPKQPSTNGNYKTKRRTKKHKTRKPERVASQGTGGAEHLVPERAETISQQSLRALFFSLLALDDRLSKEPAVTAR